MTVVTNPSVTGVLINPLSTGTDVTLGQVSANDATLTAIGTPSAPTITNVGTAGAVTWTYKIVAKIGSGATARHSAVSAGGSTTTGNATLTTANYNVVTWTAVTGATSYDIYRTAVGTTPATTGLLGNVLATSALVFNDTAVAGDSSTALTTNTTGDIAAVAAFFGGATGLSGALGTQTADGNIQTRMMNAAGTFVWGQYLVASGAAWALRDIANGVDYLVANPNGAMVSAFAVVEKQQVAAYSASITIDASQGNSFTITGTNNTAFAVNAPTNPTTGEYLEVTIRNTSGGALGVATWNAAFKMAAWTQPGNGFSATISFRYNGTNWIEVGRGGVTVPN